MSKSATTFFLRHRPCPGSIAKPGASVDSERAAAAALAFSEAVKRNEGDCFHDECTSC
jgi:hypothetical protein